MVLIELTKSEEEMLLRDIKKNAIDKCRTDVEAFVNCTKDKWFSVVWECRDLKDDMNKCLFQYTNPREMDMWKLRYLEQKRKRINDDKDTTKN